MNKTRRPRKHWVFSFDKDGLWTWGGGLCESCIRSTRRLSIGFGRRLHRGCGDEMWKCYFRDLAAGKTDEQRFPGEPEL